MIDLPCIVHLLLLLIFLLLMNQTISWLLLQFNFFFKVFSVLVARRCQIIGWTAHVLIYHWILLIAAAHFVGNKLQVWLGFFELNSVIDQKRYQEGIVEKGFNSLSKLSFVHYFYSSRSVIYWLLTELYLYYFCVIDQLSINKDIMYIINTIKRWFEILNSCQKLH